MFGFKKDLTPPVTFLSSGLATPDVAHLLPSLSSLQDFITFLGEGADSTVLTYNRKACDRKPNGSPYTILDCPTVIVQGSHFVAKDITFENSSPKPSDFDYESQAPAIRVSGDKCAFYGCTFLGWQDTLYADQGRHYYKDCRVEGNVDFVLGYAQAVFESCTMHSRGMCAFPFTSQVPIALCKVACWPGYRRKSYCTFQTTKQ